MRDDAVQSSAKAGETISEDALRLREIAAQLVLVLRDLREVLVDEFGRSAPDEEVDPEKHDREIVELAEDRDEVGDEVDREDEIARDADEDQLLLERDAPVAEQRPHQSGVRGRAPRELERLPEILRCAESSSHRAPRSAGTVLGARRALGRPPLRGRRPRR